MISNFVSKKCIPCEGGMSPLRGDQIIMYLKELRAGWEVVDEKLIKKEFKFSNFREAMVFVNKVAEIAEEEGHHPNIFIFYNKVRIELSTHSINGLSENDFILAAKLEVL